MDPHVLLPWAVSEGDYYTAVHLISSLRFRCWVWSSLEEGKEEGTEQAVAKND